MVAGRLDEVLVAMVLHPCVTHHKSLMGGGEAPHRSQKKQEAEAGPADWRRRASGVTVLLAQAMRLTGKNGRLLPMATVTSPIPFDPDKKDLARTNHWYLCFTFLR